MMVLFLIGLIIAAVVGVIKLCWKLTKSGILVTLILAVLVVVGFCGCGKSDESDLGWPTGELGQIIPKLEDCKVMEIYWNTPDSLYFYVNAEKQQYDDYKEACKNSGFNIELEDSYLFEAFNADGYKLEISYYNDNKDNFSIGVTAPLKMEEFTWAFSELAQKVPQPELLIGGVEADSTEIFSCYVKMTKEEFEVYKKKCAEAGFIVDYTNEEEHYHALNESGDEINISYKSNNVVSITAYLGSEAPTEATTAEPVTEAPTEVITTEAPTEAPTTKAQEKKSGISDEVKELMEGYEEFVDEYCEFMKNYDVTDISNLSKYTDLIKKLADWEKKISDFDSKNLSMDESLYVAEVSSRASKKILDLMK